MWRVPRPEIDAQQLFIMCSGAANHENRARLVLLEQQVVFGAWLYAKAAASATLHPLKEQLENKPKDEADRDVLVANYKSRLLKSRACRPYYEQLLAAAPYGRCPLCGHRTVSTLDHQLPKKAYPLLAVVPDNLVPACADCNRMKNDTVASDSTRQTLHPYFDVADDRRWLYAKVLPTEQRTVVFYAEPSDELAPLMQARIRHHFAEFRLAALYGPQAAREMAGIEVTISGLRHRAGPAAVGDQLRDRAAGWAAYSLNCWQHALYEALAADHGYVSEGLFAVPGSMTI